jgi:hypothetical protein
MIDPAGQSGPRYFPRMRVPDLAVTHLGTVEKVPGARPGYIWRPLCGAKAPLVPLGHDGARAEIRDGAETLVDVDGTTRELAWCPNCHAYVRAVRDTAG